MILTLTSLPFYFHCTIEILFDAQFTSTNNNIINSRTFAQMLLFGTGFNPFLAFILFFPSSLLFEWKCYSTPYSQERISINERGEQRLTFLNKRNRINQRQSKTHIQHYRCSSPVDSSDNQQFESNLWTQPYSLSKMNNPRQHSLLRSEH